MEEIYQRRSIRKYIEKEISDEILGKIIKAGMNAPSAKNTKPYEFLVVKDRQNLQKLASLKPNVYMVKDSNVTIVMLGRKTTEFWKLDIGAVIQNMLLEAAHYDIGSCWIGINKEQEEIIKKHFRVPDDLRIISMVSFAYKGEEKENNNYFEPEKIHYEKY